MTRDGVVPHLSKSVQNFSHERARQADRMKGMQTGEYMLILNDEQRVKCYSKNECTSIELTKRSKLLSLELKMKLKTLNREMARLSGELDKLEHEKIYESKHVTALKRQFENQRAVQERKYERTQIAQNRRKSIEMQKEFASRSSISMHGSGDTTIRRDSNESGDSGFGYARNLRSSVKRTVSAPMTVYRLRSNANLAL